MQKNNVLNRLDQYLLKNHPVIWRTKIHYIAIFSTLIGNVLAFVLPYLYPLTVDQLPTSNRLEFLVLITCLFAGFVVLFWGYQLSRYQLKTTTLKASLLTVFLYWIGCMSIVSNLWVFNKTVEYKIGNLIELNELNEDKEALNVYHRSKIKNNEKIFQLKSKYGVPIGRTFERAGKDGSILQNRTKVRKLNARIEFIQQCKQNSKGLYTDNGFQSLFFLTIVGLLALPMTGMLVSLSSFLPIVGFMFCHFLYMVVVFNLGYYDRDLEEANALLFVGVFVGILIAFRRMALRKLLQLFLMTIIAPMTFFYLINNVNEFRSWVDTLPALELIGSSLLVALVVGAISYWYQRSSLKPAP